MIWMEIPTWVWRKWKPSLIIDNCLLSGVSLEVDPTFKDIIIEKMHLQSIWIGVLEWCLLHLIRFGSFLNHLDEERQVYLSSIRLNFLNLICLWPIHLEKVKLDQFRVFKFNYGVKPTKKNSSRCMLFHAFMLGEW